MITDTIAAPTVLVRPLAAISPLHFFGQQALPALSAAQTDGALSLLLYIASPGDGPPRHRHRAQHETFITIDDGFEFLAYDTWHAVPPHTVVHIPAGAPHTFRNASHTPARTWVLTQQGNMEQFFGALAEVSAEAQREGSEPDLSRIMALYDAYGVEPVP